MLVPNPGHNLPGQNPSQLSEASLSHKTMSSQLLSSIYRCLKNCLFQKSYRGLINWLQSICL